MSAAATSGSRRIGRLVLAGFLVISVVVLVGLARKHLFERVEKTVEGEVSGEVARERFLALRELLTRTGLPAQTAAVFNPLPPGDHVVWWLVSVEQPADDRLLAWVEEGGHLILGPGGPAGVFDALGVGVFLAEDADEDDHLSRPELDTTRPDWPKLWLQEGVEAVRSEGATDAAWLLTVPYGEGLVTVINDSQFADNQHLAQRDNALLATRVVRADEGRAGVSLVTRRPPPAIWNVVGGEVVPAALSLGLLAVAGLWAFARRMGPVAPASSRDRRHLAEHLRASGEYLWSVGCEDTLLTAQRHALADQLMRSGARLGSRRQHLVREAAAAAERAGLDPQAVSHALKIREMRDRERFAQLVRRLEGLRRAHASHPPDSRDPRSATTRERSRKTTP